EGERGKGGRGGGAAVFGGMVGPVRGRAVVHRVGRWRLPHGWGRGGFGCPTAATRGDPCLDGRGTGPRLTHQRGLAFPPPARSPFRARCKTTRSSTQRSSGSPTKRSREGRGRVLPRRP